MKVTANISGSSVASEYPDNFIVIRWELIGSKIAFWPVLLPLLLSKQTVYLHATEAHSDLIGQYYSNYKWKTEHFQY